MGNVNKANAAEHPVGVIARRCATHDAVKKMALVVNVRVEVAGPTVVSVMVEVMTNVEIEGTAELSVDARKLDIA